MAAGRDTKGAGVSMSVCDTCVSWRGVILAAVVVAGCISPAVPARAERRGASGRGAASKASLVLPLPDLEGVSTERFTLSITIPPRVEKTERSSPSPRRKRLRSDSLRYYDFHPFKPLPRSGFIISVLRRLYHKGVVPSAGVGVLVRHGVRNPPALVDVVIRFYDKLHDIYEKGALARFPLRIADLEDFQEVLQLVKTRLKAYNRNAVEMIARVDDMISTLRKVSGKGRIKVVEVREKGDGSMVLQLQVVRED